MTYESNRKIGIFIKKKKNDKYIKVINNIFLVPERKKKFLWLLFTFGHVSRLLLTWHISFIFSFSFFFLFCFSREPPSRYMYHFGIVFNACMSHLSSCQHQVPHVIKQLPSNRNDNLSECYIFGTLILCSLLFSRSCNNEALN